MILVQRKFKNGFMDMLFTYLEFFDSIKDIPVEDTYELWCKIRFHRDSQRQATITKKKLIKALQAAGIRTGKNTTNNSYEVAFFLPVAKVSEATIGKKPKFTSYFNIQGEWIPIKDVRLELKYAMLDNMPNGDPDGELWDDMHIQLG